MPFPDCFIKKENTQYFGAYYEHRARDVQSCKRVCMDKKCKSFSMVKSTNKCWIHMNAKGMLHPDNIYLIIHSNFFNTQEIKFIPVKFSAEAISLCQY